MEKWRTFADNHPFVVVSFITLIYLFLSLIDIFILRIDELWGEIIISKALGFFIVLLYLWSVQRSVAAIGLHKTMIFQAIFIGALVSTIMVAIYFTVGFLVLTGSNVKIAVIFSPTDPKAGVRGGVLFGLWLVFGNVVNCCMEEGRKNAIKNNTEIWETLNRAVKSGEELELDKPPSLGAVVNEIFSHR